MAEHFNKIVIGAGAAGLFYCYLSSVSTKLSENSILLIDKNNEAGRKILVSGGGRCNYTNYNIAPENYLTSTSKRITHLFRNYGSEEILNLFKSWGINPIDKEGGGVFSSIKAMGLRDKLLEKVKELNVSFKYNTEIKLSNISIKDNFFCLYLNEKKITCNELIISTGGISFPGLGVSRFGYELAQHLKLNVEELKPGLVPFILSKPFKKIVGLSCFVKISLNKIEYCDFLLFTHKGISGPAVLKISSHWSKKDSIKINFLPKSDLYDLIKLERNQGGKKEIKTILKLELPSKLVDYLFSFFKLKNSKIAEVRKDDLLAIYKIIHNYEVIPLDTEGYKKAEVTVGGINLKELDNNLQVIRYPGLFFIGEVCDVTGDLGGYNFQWAWTSAFLASNFKKIKNKK